MTCIVGLAHDGKVWMGADRCISWGEQGLVFPANQSKIFAAGGVLMGGSGSSSISSLQSWEDKFPARRDFIDPRHYLVRGLVPALVSIASESGELKTENGQIELPWHLLVGIEGRLFEIDNAGDVVEPGGCFWAVGSGRSVALGALHTISGAELSPQDKLLTALRATSDLCGGVSPPFDIECTP